MVIKEGSLIDRKSAGNQSKQQSHCNITGKHNVREAEVNSRTLESIRVRMPQSERRERKIPCRPQTSTLFILSSQSPFPFVVSYHIYLDTGDLAASTWYSARRMISSTGPSSRLNPSRPSRATLISVLATTLAARGLSSSRANSPK